MMQCSYNEMAEVLGTGCKLLKKQKLITHRSLQPIHVSGS